MSYGKYVWIVVAVCGLFAGAAYSQEPVMVLDHKEMGAHERPLVSFTHEKHSSVVDCIRCHHDYDKYGNVKSSEGQPCADCHKPGSGKQPESLTSAFHFMCKGCHEDWRAGGQQGAGEPVTCGECHVRK